METVASEECFRETGTVESRRRKPKVNITPEFRAETGFAGRE